VESNVRLHITDAGEGRPIVLIPGWPLSDEMYELNNHDRPMLLANFAKIFSATQTSLNKGIGN